ncbi:hypothetical protein ACFYPZ_39605 [Streptomyces sp. NPDC005506]|uniref:hypothetical protein n=1 Tax=unclassified Streptomyces TaxID=2593676 RepID=UPI003684499E
MTDWSRLNHAYGTAQDIPGLLDAMSPDPQDAGWDALWSRLCHQGTVYSASYAALPAFADTARQWSAAERRAPLYLAGAIVASIDRPDSGEDPYLSHPAAIAELRGLTEEALQDPGLTGDPLNYVQLLGTLLSFEGVEVWGEQIDGLNGEGTNCPAPPVRRRTSSSSASTATSRPRTACTCDTRPPSSTPSGHRTPRSCRASPEGCTRAWSRTATPASRTS